MIVIKTRFITRVRMYMLFMFLSILGLVYHGYTYKRNEISFTSKTIYDDNKIKADDGKFYPFVDSLATPKYVYDYVATIKNDTVVSYRRKMSNLSEFVYIFGAHETYDQYETHEKEDYAKNHTKSEIETHNVNRVDNALTVLFWIIGTIWTIAMVISLFVSIFGEENEENIYSVRLKFLYIMLREVLFLLLFFHAFNYSGWLVGLYAFLGIIDIIAYSVVNDSGIEPLGVGESLTHYGRIKQKQSKKYDKLKTEYDKLLVGNEKNNEKKKEKRIITI